MFLHRLAPLMKITATLIILTAFSSLLLAQTESDEIDMLTISYNGDSTLMIEKYEIYHSKEKIYYINPIMIFWILKGEKYRTRIRVKKQDWKKIKSLTTTIYHNRNDENEKTNEEIPIYYINFLKRKYRIKSL